MRRVGVKRSSSEEIGSWDLPPLKRTRVESSQRTGSRVWIRLASGFGGLLSTVRRWFSRPRDSISSPPHMSEAPSSSSAHFPPPHSPHSPHSPSVSLTAPAPPSPPHSSIPASQSHPSPPPVTTHTLTHSPAQPLPPNPSRERPKQPPLPVWSNSSHGSWLWSQRDSLTTSKVKPSRPPVLSPPSTSSRITPHTSSFPIFTSRPSHVLHVTPHPSHLTPSLPTLDPESIGPKLRGWPHPPSLTSSGGNRPSTTYRPSTYHCLPHSPPPSPLPSSDVVQRRKWVELVKADHTHSLSQHQAAVGEELRRLAECRERRFRAEDSRVRHLQDNMRNMSLLSNVSLSGEEEEEEEEMGPLTEQQEQKVEAALSRGPGGEVLSVKFNISIKRDDVRTLAGLNWLNDEVINFYMNLIVERGKQEGSACRVHAMSSFFYPKLCEVGYSGVRRWTKKVDIFSIDLLLYPIHLGSHWCLAAIHTTRKTLSYYDSLGGRGRSCLETLRQYLVSEHRDKRKTELSLEGWRDIDPGDIPLQKNGSDCGVFTCMYARYLASNTAFTFSQEHMPDIRRHIVCELLEQRIL